MIKHLRFSSCFHISFLIVLLTAALLLITPEPAMSQGFAISYGDVEFIVTPGGKITGSFRVTNQSGERQRLRIYSGDWVRMPGHVSTYQFDVEGGLEDRSFVEWMIFNPDQMELDPDEGQDVFYEVRFPDDPTLEGSYWGVIFVEEIPIIELGEGIPNGDDMHVTIRTVFRYAVKIYATIEGTEVREGTFTALDLERTDSGFNVDVTFENSGNIYMRPEVWLEIRDTSGEFIYQQDYIHQTVLPETSREYNFIIENLYLEPGTYLLLVIADYGVPTRIAAQSTIIINEAQEEAVDNVEGEREDE